MGSARVTLRSMDVAAHAGTGFDGQQLFRLAEGMLWSSRA
jgi:hypothetical protein